mgnify:CR=1 FL=1
MNKNKQFERMKMWRADWVLFAKEVLHAQLDKEQEAILRAVQNERMVAVASGTARGKDYIAAVACLCFMYLTPRWKNGKLVKNTKIAMTAPCYDEETEILTDSGWKLFKDLLPTDRVAQKRENNEIEFVFPIDYIVASYNGEMIGCKSKLVDFLVTPKHRCLFKSLMAKNYSVRQAGEIYGMYGNFIKEAKWKKSETDADLDWFEFLGFWFAKGSAQVDAARRKYRIILTQNSTEYVEDLINRNVSHFKNEFHRYAKKSGGYNWELYQKDIAEVFFAYGKALTKKVPQWIKDAGTEELLSFLKGYLVGDGFTDKNGCQKLCTSSIQLANDLHEMAVKAGLIANFKKYTSRKRKVMYDENGHITGWKFVEGQSIYYEIKFSKRGHFPKVEKKHWYKKVYNGNVYCVKVPTGMVMVRRNGYNHWSGNTDRQVRNIMVPEVRRLFKGSQVLPGRLVGYDIRTNYEEWFLTGFKSSADNTEAWSGFHAVNVMFVVTEASGISETIFNAIEGNLQGNSRLLLVFNPNITTGYAAGAMKSERFKKFRLNSLYAENVVSKENRIPGQVDYEWVKDKVKSWCLPIRKEDFNEGEGDFDWEGQSFRPNDLFRVKVLGMFPKVSEDVLIPYEWIEIANERWKELQEEGFNPKKKCRLGVDVAGMGRDSSVLCPRYGNYVEKFEVHSSAGVADHMHVVGMIVPYLKQNGVKAFIDTIGEGAGVFSRLKELGYQYAYSCKFSAGTKGLSDITEVRSFANMRAYLYWAVRDWLDPKNGFHPALPPNDYLMQECTELHWKFLSNGDIIIESKEDVKKRLGRSTDYIDSLANTFYPRDYKVIREEDVFEDML